MEPSPYTLITGASSGIGRSAAAQLSASRNLILHGRDAERLEETRAACRNPGQHLSWSFDLKSPAEIEASLAPLLSAAGGAVEAFVHCAGMVTVLPMRSVDYGVLREIMDVNFFSAAEIVRVLLKKKVNGQSLAGVVFVSSIWSRFGARGHSAYTASKAALDGLMRSLAVELAPRVRVNSILPGAVRTAMADEGFADPAIAAKLEQDYPLGVGKPADIASAIEFVLSPAAGWLTGQSIAIDGGRTVNMSLK